MSLESHDYRIRVQRQNGQTRILLLNESGLRVLNPDAPWSGTLGDATRQLNADIGAHLVRKGVI